MFDRKYLFDLLRNAPFGGRLTTLQVKVVGLILDLCETLKLPLPFIAYIIATAFHETGGTFNPGKENLNYSVAALKSKFSRERISLKDAERYGRSDGTVKRKANQSAIANLIYGGAWGLRQLGNRLVGDGWKFIGRGLVQLTGRRNYEIFGLAENPDGAMVLEKAVEILVKGMNDGVFTGKKLSDFYSNGVFRAVDARAIVNGTDKASLISRHYGAILVALEKSEVRTDNYTDDFKLEAEKETLADVSEVKTDDVKAAESGIAKSIYGATGATFVTGLVAAISSPWGAAVAIVALAIGGLFLYGHLSGKLEFKR